MTIYQEEMQRKAQHCGCITSYAEADQLLLISHKGVHLTAINPEGFMFYNSKDLTDPESREVFSHLTDDAETVREYVGLYESSPQMKPKDVQNYRKLSEYGAWCSLECTAKSTALCSVAGDSQTAADTLHTATTHPTTSHPKRTSPSVPDSSMTISCSPKKKPKNCSSVQPSQEITANR